MMNNAPTPDPAWDKVAPDPAWDIKFAGYRYPPVGIQLGYKDK